ncbi:MAG: kynureninase [Planctomycetota bacterium]|nr:kynureninase [Planctomycetota bacterium]
MDWSQHLKRAAALDEGDELRGMRAHFALPSGADGRACVYMCGNSLGLMPKRTREILARELDDWSKLGVEGHFREGDGWFGYHELVRGPLARLVGAEEREVVAMNSLTVNLHLLMTSFYRPEGRAGGRRAILIEKPCFPSDVYAVKSQLRLHGVPEEEGLLRVEPRAGEWRLREEDVEEVLRREGRRIALVLLAGVNYATGQRMDIERLTRAGHAAGCVVGWDLAHAAGNVPLELHAWGPDFAAWCSYKYLNSGPGAVAGAFVHARHLGRGAELRRLEGWWGNDPRTRFVMGETFVAAESADAWQLSNPPILALAPLRASLELFDKAGMARLRAKSERLTGFLLELIDGLEARGRVEVITPRDVAARGCQLSVRIARGAEDVLKRLQARGVVCDFRRPDVIRLAPAPLYCTFDDCVRAVRALSEALAEGGS